MTATLTTTRRIKMLAGIIDLFKVDKALENDDFKLFKKQADILNDFEGDKSTVLADLLELIILNDAPNIFRQFLDHDYFKNFDAEALSKIRISPSKLTLTEYMIYRNTFNIFKCFYFRYSRTANLLYYGDGTSFLQKNETLAFMAAKWGRVDFLEYLGSQTLSVFYFAAKDCEKNTIAHIILASHDIPCALWLLNKVISNCFFEKMLSSKNNNGMTPMDRVRNDNIRELFEPQTYQLIKE